MSLGKVARGVGRTALVAIGVLVIGSGSAALARQGAVSTAQPDPQGLSPPVVAGSTAGIRIDPQKLALAEQVYDIMGAPALRASTRSLTSGLSVQLATALSAHDPARAKAMVEAVSDGLTSLTPQLQAEATSHIAREFTLDQLKEMLAFYTSPTGRLAARRMPMIQSQTVGGILGYLPQMMAGVEDSYCSRVKCTRAEKKAFDDVSARMAAEHPAAAG